MRSSPHSTQPQPSGARNRKKPGRKPRPLNDPPSTPESLSREHWRGKSAIRFRERAVMRFTGAIEFFDIIIGNDFRARRTAHIASPLRRRYERSAILRTALHIFLGNQQAALVVFAMFSNPARPA